MSRSRYLWVILLVAAISGCSGLASSLASSGIEAGKCVAGQFTPPALIPSTPAPAPTGEFMFMAPAGSRFALCAW